MARIRTIKPEFFTSDDICSLSMPARLLYIGIWCEADKEGRLEWSPRNLKRRYLPDDQVDVDALCAELVDRGLVVLYGEDLAHIPKFSKHQHINPRESASKLPEPDASPTRRPRVNDASSTREARDSDAQGGREGKGREGKGREGEEPLSPSLALDGDAPADLNARKAQRIQQIAADAQAAYNRILAKPAGLLTACTVLNKPRMKAVEKSIATAKLLCREMYGSERVTAQFWDDYFTEAARDDFHAGRGPYRPPHDNWRPDFEFLLREDVMAKLFDRAQSADPEGAAA